MIRIAVLCPSEIAFRRFMPALKKIENIEFAGIGHANEKEWFGCVSKEHNLTILNEDHEKANRFVEVYGGVVYDSFNDIFTSDDIDAVYIPLPPGLHYKWAKRALECGKHVLVEKPSTTSIIHTGELICLAKQKQLAFHENYMFLFHSQIEYIKTLIEKKAVGDVRLLRISFGFPFRGANDFRYSKNLGGGALFDCGGYTIKLASVMLGPTATLVTHHLNYTEEFGVDLYGSATMKNKDGLIAQVSFGMDNSYKCDLEIWGSTGTIFTGRIFTAPVGFEPVISIKIGDSTQEIKLGSDDAFKKSIIHFINCIGDSKIRNETYDDILKQAAFVDEIREG